MGYTMLHWLVPVSSENHYQEYEQDSSEGCWGRDAPNECYDWLCSSAAVSPCLSELRSMQNRFASERSGSGTIFSTDAARHSTFQRRLTLQPLPSSLCDLPSGRGSLVRTPRASLRTLACHRHFCYPTSKEDVILQTIGMEAQSHLMLASTWGNRFNPINCLNMLSPKMRWAKRLAPPWFSADNVTKFWQ